MTQAPSGDHVGTAADRLAVRAAERAGVHIELLGTLSDMEAAEALINDTWRNPTSEISVGVLRAVGKSGNFVSGAFEGGVLVGACVAFFGISGRTELYSHLAAVAGDRRGRGIGFALKVHQRAWALQAGVDTISWTYDPLVRRNAHVNVGKLRAAPVEYLPNFYGARTDNINGSLTTDRVLVRWHLARPETQRACAGEVATPDLSGAEVVLSCGPDDEPVEKRNDDSRRVLVAVPPDIAALRKARPDVAGAWRAALEQHLGNALMKGARVTGFTKQGYYVVDRAPATQEETR